MSQFERDATTPNIPIELAVIAHTCGWLAVMNAGRIVEETSVERLRRAELEHPHTRQLLRASLGYDRAAAAEFVTNEQADGWGLRGRAWNLLLSCYSAV